MSVSTPPAPPSAGDALIAARDAAVVCNLAPLRLLAVAGPDAATFLQGQLSANVAGVVPGAVRYASFNSPKGRMLANFPLWHDAGADGGYRLLLPEDLAERVAKRLAMYVLRSKVTLEDVSAGTVRLGVGGPAAADAVRAALGSAPEPLAVAAAGPATVIGLPGPRYAVTVPAASAEAVGHRLHESARAAPFSVWRWLTIRAGVPIVTAATQDAFVAQTANWDILGGIDFRKGCYTGQEIIARMQYLGRLKERAFLFHVDLPDAAPGARLFSAAFGDQPCGTVVDAAPAPGGGCDLLAVLQLAAAESGDAHLGAPDGPVLASLPLPYAIPPAGEPRGRVG